MRLGDVARDELERRIREVEAMADRRIEKCRREEEKFSRLPLKMSPRARLSDIPVRAAEERLALQAVMTILNGETRDGSTYCSEGCTPLGRLATAEAEVERLTRERDEARADLESAEKRFAEIAGVGLILKAEVERLRAERDAARLSGDEALLAVSDVSRRLGLVEAERDALRAWMERARVAIRETVRVTASTSTADEEPAATDAVHAFEAIRALLADCPVTAPEGKP